MMNAIRWIKQFSEKISVQEVSEWTASTSKIGSIINFIFQNIDAPTVNLLVEDAENSTLNLFTFKQV